MINSKYNFFDKGQEFIIDDAGIKHRVYHKKFSKKMSDIYKKKSYKYLIEYGDHLLMSVSFDGDKWFPKIYTGGKVWNKSKYPLAFIKQEFENDVLESEQDYKLIKYRKPIQYSDLKYYKKGLKKGR